MADALLRRDPALPFQEIEGLVVVVAPARREVHQLDETATFLWSCLAEPRTVGELAEAVREAFEVEADRAEADVRAFVAELEAKGLVLRS